MPMLLLLLLLLLTKNLLCRPVSIVDCNANVAVYWVSSCHSLDRAYTCPSLCVRPRKGQQFFACDSDQPGTTPAPGSLEMQARASSLAPLIHGWFSRLCGGNRSELPWALTNRWLRVQKNLSLCT